jgi:predicted DNA-binding protein (MmcQ/YjbR family)
MYSVIYLYRNSEFELLYENPHFLSSYFMRQGPWVHIILIGTVKGDLLVMDIESRSHVGLYVINTPR